MLGIWAAHTNIYLVVVGVVTLVLFGLPLMFVPMQWARLFRWEIPQSSKLASFLGSSLGIFISIIAIFAIKAAQNPVAQPFFFSLLFWVLGGMILLHVYGAIRRAQPVTETVEIVLWVVLFVITLGFYPVS